MHGRAGAVYDLPADEAVELLAWWVTRTQAPRCWGTISPATLGDNGRFAARKRGKD